MQSHQKIVKDLTDQGSAVHRMGGGGVVHPRLRDLLLVQPSLEPSVLDDHQGADVAVLKASTLPQGRLGCLRGC